MHTAVSSPAGPGLAGREWFLCRDVAVGFAGTFLPQGLDPLDEQLSQRPAWV